MRSLFGLNAIMVCITLLGSGMANACIVMIPLQERLEHGFSENVIKGVAIVSIKKAERIATRAEGLEPFKASGHVIKRLKGKGLPDVIAFERGWGASACEWNTPPLPQEGDKWAVYLQKGKDGRFKPWLAMPLAEAKSVDMRFVSQYQF